MNAIHSVTHHQWTARCTESMTVMMSRGGAPVCGRDLPQPLASTSSMMRESSRCSTSAPRLPLRDDAHTSRRRTACAGSRFNEFSLWRGTLPPRPTAEQEAGVVPGARTVVTRLLSPQQVFDRLHQSVHKTALDHFGAFYSSELGGIATSPAVMLVHMDDHMVHRGHAVFDTSLITEGHLYQLPQHVERFKRSAYMAGLTIPLTDPHMLRIILDTAAASRIQNGIVKFWVSAGRGGFGLSRMDCLEPTFYVMASSETTRSNSSSSSSGAGGLAACASTVAPKPTPYGTIKSTNYMTNALAQIRAEQQGMDVGLFVDAEGFILEGPNSNFCMLTQQDVLVTPPFDSILSGITIQTLMKLAADKQKLKGVAGTSVKVSKVEQRRIHSDEVYQAKEAFLVGSTKPAVPITSWNGKPIGGGQPGPAAVAFAALLAEDQRPGEDSTQHVAVPYGSMVGRLGV